MRTSASQLEKVLGCVRAAAFHYTDRIRKPGGSEFNKDLGRRIHHYVRQYVQTGQEPDLTEILWREVKNLRTGLVTNKTYFPGQIAAAAFPLLKKPPHTEHWHTETSIDGVRLPSGIELMGDIDLAIDEGDVGEIRDYKTTSDFAYALTEEKLLVDIQANTYAWAWFKAQAEGRIRTRAPEVLLHWQYLLTKGNPRSHSVRATCSKEGNAREIERIDREIATPWAKLRLKQVSGYELPPTGLGTGQCEKYLGCPYRGVECQITADDAIRYGGMMNQPLVNLNELLAAKLAGQQTLTQVAPPAFQAPAPSNPFLEPGPGPIAPKTTARPSFWIPGDPMNEIQEFAAAKGKPLSFIANAADNPPPAEVAASYDVKVEAGSINPPESAGMVPAVNPQAAQALQGSTPPEAESAGFAALKAECERLGILPPGAKLKTPGLKKLLDAYELERARAEKQGFITPGSRPPIADLRKLPMDAFAPPESVPVRTGMEVSFAPMAPTEEIAKKFQDAGLPVKATPQGSLDFRVAEPFTIDFSAQLATARPLDQAPIMTYTPPTIDKPEQYSHISTDEIEAIASRAAELTVARLIEALKRLA